jgi:hypothetical protein
VNLTTPPAPAPIIVQGLGKTATAAILHITSQGQPFQITLPWDDLDRLRAAPDPQPYFDEERAGSHQPVLRAILATYDTISPEVLEMGSGPSSTPLFLKAGVFLTSVEAKEEWRNWMGEQGMTHTILDTTPTDLRHFDVVFVDGEQTDRAAVAQGALDQGVPWVILHDSELPAYYGYDTITVHQEYRVTEYHHPRLRKSTTVLTLSPVSLGDIEDHEGRK